MLDPHTVTKKKNRIRSNRTWTGSSIGAIGFEPLYKGSLGIIMCSDITRVEAGPHYCKAVAHGDTIYFSGAVPPKEDWDKDIHTQVRSVLNVVDANLKTMATNKSRILSISVYLAHIGDFAAMNEVWSQWIDNDHLPVRTTVEARLAFPGIKIEVTVIAAKVK